MSPTESTPPRDRFRPQLRVSGALLLALVVFGAPVLFSRSYAALVAGLGLPWPLELVAAPGGFWLHGPIGLVLGIAMVLGRAVLGGVAALLAGLWGLFIVAAWYSLLGLPFAYFGGLGISVLASEYLPRGPRWLQGVAFPAIALLVGSRAILVGAGATTLVQHLIRTERYERNQPAKPEVIRCDDTLDWLCAPGLDLDSDESGSIAVLSTDGSVSLWDRKGRKRWRRPSSEPAAAAFPLLRFTSDGSHLLLVFAKEALLLDSATGEDVAALETPREGALDDRAFTIVDREIVSAGPAWTFYDDSTGSIRESAPSGCGVAHAVAPATTAGRFWVACGERVLLWDRNSGEERTVETFAPEARVLSIGGAGADGTVLGQVVLPKTPSALWRFSEDPATASVDLRLGREYPVRERQALRFDARGRVAFPFDGGGRVLDVRTGRELKRNSTPPLQAMAWGVDSRSVLILTTDGTGRKMGIVRQWSLPEPSRGQAEPLSRSWHGDILVK